MKKGSKQLIKDMDKTAETLYNLSDEFANLFQLTNQMNSSMNIGKVQLTIKRNHFFSLLEFLIFLLISRYFF